MLYGYNKSIETNAPPSGVGALFSRFKRSLSLFAISVISFSVFSGTAIAYQIDEYERPALSGGVSFEFQRTDNQISGNSFKTQNFMQTYFLDFKNNLINRRLLIYNASVAYTNNSVEYGGAKNSTSSTQFYLTSTLLPNSAIPLEAHYGKKTSSSAQTASSINESTNYGLNWYGRFRTLPETRLYYENTSAKDPIATTTTVRAGGDLKKEIGPTKNEFAYAKDTLTSGHANSGSTITSMNASNYTTLGKNTNINAYGNSSDSQSSNGNFSKSQGASMNLSSSPSDEFNQDHSYIFADSKQAGLKQTLQTYSGRINYNYSRELRASAHVNAENSVSTDQFSTATTNAVNSGANVNYALGRRFALGETVQYVKTASTIGNNAVGAVNTYTLSETSHLSFNERISIVSFGASYGLGYTEEQAYASSLNRGISQNASAHIGSPIPEVINLKLSASYSYTSNLQKNGPNQTIITSSASATNIILQEYVGLSASYSKNSTKAWISALEGSSETSSFSANVKNIPNTTLTSSANISRHYTAVVGSSRYNSENIAIGHNRNVFNGQLGAKFSLMFADSFTATSSTKVVTFSYSANYSKELITSLNWTLNATRTESIQSQVTSKTTSISNRLAYPLRSWNISTDHTYSLTEQTGNLRISYSQFFLRLSRDFGIYI